MCCWCLHIGLLHEVNSSNAGISESQILLACWYFSFCCCVALFQFIFFLRRVLLSQSMFWGSANLLCASWSLTISVFSCNSSITLQYCRRCVQAKHVNKLIYRTSKIPTVKSSFKFSENQQLSVSRRMSPKNIWNVYFAHRALDWISKRFTPPQVSMVTFWRVLSTNCEMGVQLLYSKLNILVISNCSFFLKFSGKMRMNMPNAFGNFLGKTPCVKKVIVF